MASRKPPIKVEKVDLVHVSPTVVRWLVGFFAALFALLTGYWAVADRVDNHWLTTDKAKIKFNGVDRSLAWILFSIQDFKASAADKWLQDCRRDPRSKGPNDCKQLEDQAQQFKQEALELKREAGKASKAKDVE